MIQFHHRFVNPERIGVDVTPNSYFPLVVGTVWHYVGGDETVDVTVLDQTKFIEGVTGRVVRDVVKVDGVLLEDTLDWYAQDVDGAVWYCGESVQDFEVFEGDDPQDPELIAIEGSFKAGLNGDFAGIQMLALPRVGDAYRQEVSMGNAEDAAEVVSITGSAIVPGGVVRSNLCGCARVHAH